jgi:hypothetical protein
MRRRSLAGRGSAWSSSPNEEISALPSRSIHNLRSPKRLFDRRGATRSPTLHARAVSKPSRPRYGLNELEYRRRGGHEEISSREIMRNTRYVILKNGEGLTEHHQLRLKGLQRHRHRERNDLTAFLFHDIRFRQIAKVTHIDGYYAFTFVIIHCIFPP